MTLFLQAILANVVLSAVLAGIVMVVSRLSRNPQLVHALWVLVLVKLVTPPIVQLPLPVWQGAAVEARRSGEPASSAAVAEVVTLPARLASEQPLPEPRPASRPLPRADSRFGDAVGRILALGIPGLLLFTWGAGSLVIVGVGIRRIRRFTLLMADTEPADGSIQADVRELARRLGLRRSPDVRVVRGVVPPVVWFASAQPIILLPARLLEQLDRAGQRTVLAHELAHVRRGDHWVRWMEAIVIALYWWNPIVWLACRELNLSEEECCDAWVVWLEPECRRTYAGAIVQTVEFLSSARAVVPFPASAIGLRFPLKTRVAAILAPPLAHRLTWPLRLAVVSAALLGLPTIVVPDRSVAALPSTEAIQSTESEPERRLSDIATLHPRFDGDFYGWLSNDAFLVACSDPDHPRGILFTRELASGRETALPALTKLYNQADGGSILQISPDGRWVLWWTGKIHEVAIHGARLDGSGHFQIAKAKADTDNLDVFWLSDSRRFVELAMPHLGKFERALVRQAEKPDAVEVLPISESDPIQVACAIAGRDITLAAGDRLIALPCSLHGYGSLDSNAAIGESGVLLRGSGGNQTTPLVPPSKSIMICGAAVGPRSDHIAWLVEAESANDDTRVGLWTTRLDGSQWVRVGFEQTVKPDTGFGEHLENFMADAPGGVQWLPDGKTLSFFYKGDLYTVPAPSQ